VAPVVLACPAMTWPRPARPSAVAFRPEASRLAFASTPSIHPGLPVNASVLNWIRRENARHAGRI